MKYNSALHLYTFGNYLKANILVILNLQDAQNVSKIIQEV